MQAASASDIPREPERVGRYLVFRAFAQGGMASVHLGRLFGASGFSRLVAIKRLHPLFAASQDHYRMLLDEARITSRIHHPNVVPTLDVIHEDAHSHSASGGPVLCLVMEYVSGVSFADVLGAARKNAQKLPPNIAVAIVVDLLRGLHAAHEAKTEDGAPLGIVHRDVSPHNVLVGADGVARVLDFGIAKALRKEHLTISGEVKGKLSYMSPEQLRGLAVTRQADLFAAGIILWEALVGDRLYVEGEPAAVILRVLTDPPRPPSARAQGVSPALDAIVLRALSPEPRGRFATAEEMAVELCDACPPASREDVARFVEYVAGDELERRADLAREAENYRAQDPPMAISMAAPRDPSTPSGTRPAPGVDPRAARVSSLVAAAIVAVALVAGAFAVRAYRTRPLAAPAESARALEPAEPPADSARAAGEPSSLPPVSPLDRADDVPAPPTPPAAHRAATHPRAPRRPSGGAAPTNPCEPPYSIDENGRKHYKPECLK